MSKHKRDRPGKRGGIKEKLSNVLIVLLAIVAIGSVVSVSSMFDSSGSASKPSSKPGGSIVVTPPESDSGTDIPTGTVINDSLLNVPFCYNQNDLFDFRENHMVYSNPDGLSIGSAYTTFLLAPEAVPFESGITLTDYSRVKIELNLMNLESDDTLGCRFFLIGRTENSSPKLSAASEIYVLPSEDSEDMTIRLSNGQELTASTFKITYLIDVNRDTPELSRLQLYVGDTVYIDTVATESTLFTAQDIVWLSDIRFMNFNAASENATLGFNGMKVTVYN